VDRQVYRAAGPLGGLVDEVMSMPLRRDRPLWELWICENATDEHFAIVGKLHHCMVDGLAAVELGSLLLDITPEPEPEPYGSDVWEAAREPGAERLLLRGARDLLAQQLALVSWPLRAITSPAGSAREAAANALRMTRALSHSLVRGAPTSMLNRPLSPLRRLAWSERPLRDLQLIKRTYGTTVNDVMLAAVAGGIRAYLIDHGEPPVALKAMVPVNVRGARDELGNHISFVFAELPCDEPDPLGRLYRLHATMSQRKRDGEPQGADLALKAAGHTPGVVQQAISRIIASPRTFNLVVSNIPGPSQPLYMLGCRLQATYPVVPLADRHAVSIGMTTIRDRACLAVYADREAIPDAETLVRDIDRAVAELLEGAAPSRAADADSARARRPAATGQLRYQGLAWDAPARPPARRAAGRPTG
jgi:diacylglycerol O-acyltransferase / wax synthase